MFSPMKILDDDANIQQTEDMIGMDHLTINGNLLDRMEFQKRRRAFQHEWDLLAQAPKCTGWIMLERVLRQLPNLREVDVVSTDQIGSKDVLDAFPGHGALQFTHAGVETLPDFLRVVIARVRQLSTIRIFDQDDPHWFTGVPSIRTSRPGPGRNFADQYLDISAISSGLEGLRYPDDTCRGLVPVMASLERSASPFPALKTLEVCGRRADVNSYRTFCTALRSVLTMPPVTANIERLAIGCEGTDTWIHNLQDVFGSTELPKLSHLGLHWWSCPAPSYMADLLIRHRTTLQRVSFVKVVTRDSWGPQEIQKDWNTGFDLLRGAEFPHLRQFDLTIPAWPAPDLTVSAISYILRQHDDSPFRLGVEHPS